MQRAEPAARHPRPGSAADHNDQLLRKYQFLREWHTAVVCSSGTATENGWARRSGWVLRVG